MWRVPCPASIARMGAVLLIALATGSFSPGSLATPSESAALDTSASNRADVFRTRAAENLIELRDPLPSLLATSPIRADVERDALARLEGAMAEWRSGNRTIAAHRADSALALIPAVADWRPLVLAELLAPTGDTILVRDAVRRLDPATDMASRWGWRFLAEAHEAANDRAGASRVARAAAAGEREPSRAAEQWLFAGRMALAQGDLLTARGDLWNAVVQGSGLAAAGVAARLLDPIAGTLSAEDELRLGLVLLEAAAWDAGRRRLAPHLQGPISPEQLTEVRLGLGRALFELRRFPEAEEVLAPLVNAAAGGLPPGPGGGALRTALSLSGRAALERGALTTAEGHFRMLAALAPGSTEAEEGLHLLLTRELRTGFGPRSRVLLDDLLTSGIRNTAVETTVVQLGTTQYMNGDFQSAAATFDRYLSGSLRSAGRQQAAYWSALAHERGGNGTIAAGRLAEAHSADPFSVYGGFAGHRIAAQILDPSLPPGPPPVPGLDRELDNALTRLRVHRIVPTSGSLAWELERLTRHFLGRGDGAYDFAEAMIQGGFPLQAIVLGRDLHRIEEEWNLRLLRIVHPLPHSDILLRESAARGLDPFFVAGLIRQESAWDHRIVSSAGATGLMQLMPATAREVAGSLGVPLGPESLSDPEVNIRLGTTYLQSMLSRFDHRAEDALAAYNAGPGRLSQWRREPMYRDRDVFMEQIPFQETRNYVKIVQQYTRIYTALYGCGSLEPCLGLSYPEVVAVSTVALGTPRLTLTR